MHLTCLAIDKIRYGPFRDAADRYLDRLQHYATVTERELKPARGKQGDAQLKLDESERILEAVPEGALLVALDERGKRLSSTELAELIRGHRDLGQHLCFAIGGALGHAPLLRKRARRRIRLSDLTLPHELARVLLYEQLYRAMTILRGEPYHK